MKARLPLLLALVLPSAAEEGLSLEASREDGALRARVESLPEKAVASLSIERVFPDGPPVPLGRYRMVMGPGNRGEALYAMGEELSVPGSYRVRASFERLGQYPEVLKALEGRRIPPAEVLLEADLAGKAYLQALLDEQAYLLTSMAWTEGFLEGLARAKTEGLEPWKAWRAKAIPELQGILEHGKLQGRRFFPRSYLSFSSGFLFALLQKESNEFLAANDGTAYHGTGRFKDPAPVRKEELAPERERLLKEAGLFRLSVLRVLARSPHRPGLHEVLALWSSDPQAFEDPRWKSLMDLAPLFKAWLDAEPEGKDAAKAALDSRYSELEAVFKGR